MSILTDSVCIGQCEFRSSVSFVLKICIKIKATSDKTRLKRLPLLEILLCLFISCGETTGVELFVVFFTMEGRRDSINYTAGISGLHVIG